jgi:two-component system sensor histidine kinase DesK
MGDIGAGLGDSRGGNLPPWAHGWRRVLLSIGLLVYPAIAASSVADYASGALAALGYGLIAAFCICFLLCFAAIARYAARQFWILLGIMTVLFIAVIPISRVNSFALCAVIVSLAAIPLRRRVVPLVVVAAIASLIVPVLVPSWHTGIGWAQAAMIVFTALLTYSFSEVVRANRTLVEARAEVARLASEAERNRIARDLHDLVGHSLTAITVKSNLARQLAENESSPAIREITEVEQLSRQALADVRAAVSGYREVTLATELARGRELLRASGVTADFPTATDFPTAIDPIDEQTQELFGWAVREGVTNVVRHARASRCTVTVSATAVEIRDDGAASPAAWGNGLEGLRERADAVGARVEAGPDAPRGWRLRVST